jgi:hypothetical protein
MEERTERQELNSLLIFNIAQHYRILHRVYHGLSQHNLKFCAIAIIESFVIK